jgi:uncharacterized protein
MPDSNKSSIIIPIVVGSCGIFAMSYIGYLLREDVALLTISEFKVVNYTFTMQLYVLPLSFVAILFVFVYDRNAFRSYFRFTLKSKDTESTWASFGPIITIAFAMGLAALMSFEVMASKGTMNSTFFQIFPLVLLFAATNAWTEEILSRFVIVAGLSGKVQPNTICLISAVMFGLPHFFGTPSGLFGVITSGILGWMLAKSVIETKSLGWALLIHFVMDVIIFGSGAMIIAGSVN